MCGMPQNVNMTKLGARSTLYPFSNLFIPDNQTKLLNVNNNNAHVESICG